jgi:NAD(P)-dependent dehydrogenase (short-subunit alcohol dehydrogenase family)
VEALIKETVKRFDRLDCAHNNAGIFGMGGPTVECTEENWDRITGVNLKGVWLCMKYEIPQMLKQGKGTIVNTASAAGLTGLQGLPAYVASKHGVVGLTKAAAYEYAQSGIRINSVAPGVIRTRMTQDRIDEGGPEIEARLNSRNALNRMGTPEEVAEAVMWLCSDAASFVTGQTIPVDGAWLVGLK